ncbi:carboxylesterase/lipase family protein [Gryllotalpicola koreensis]|uniref:Carboxylic ester hydrolase n=1 Tax=Gryllotalpicola koreensis TaxID=993086 RepID=A0ABP7ZQP2_9MICO
MPASADATVTARTAAGPVLGLTGGGVDAYLGIPYAAAPVGPLRFQPPQSAPLWEDSWDARRSRAAAPQPEHGGESIIGSEDGSLLLSIWTPSGAQSLPVIVWIHGGGFETGSGTPPFTDAAELARVSGCVVVAINYRLGALGWLDLPSLDPEGWGASANLGLQDQIAALVWVRENIAAFGGDAGKITLAGQSAGGFSIAALLAAPAAAGLFSAGVLLSGAAERIFPRETTTAMARALLAELGITTPQRLMRVGAHAIVRAQAKVIDHDIGVRNLPGGRSFGTVIDGEVLPEAPLQAVRAGRATGVRLWVAATTEEMRLFEVAHAPDYAPASEQILLDELARAGAPDPAALLAAYRVRHPGAGLARLRTHILTDRIYRLPAARLAHLQRKAGGEAWLALTAAAPWGEPLGAAHGADLPLVFGAGQREAPPATGVDAQLIEHLQLLLGRFAAGLEPGWPQYDPDAATTRVFGGQSELVIEPPADTATTEWRWSAE